MVFGALFSLFFKKNSMNSLRIFTIDPFYKWITKGMFNRKIDCFLLSILQFLFAIQAFRALLLAHTACKLPKCKACVLRQILVHYIRTKGPIVCISKHLLNQLRIDQKQNDPSEQLVRLLADPEILRMLMSLIMFAFTEKVSLRSFYKIYSKRSSMTARL